MPLDPSLSLQVKPIEIANPIDLQTKALTLRSLGQQTQMQDQQFQDSQSLRDAFKQNVGADGAINRQGVLGALAQSGNGKAVMDYSKYFQDQDLQKLKTQSEMGKQLAWSVSDETSYQAAKANLAKVDPAKAAQMPPHYDKPFVDNWQMHSLEGDKQLDAQMKQQQLGLEKQKVGASIEGNRINRERLGMDKEDKAATALAGHLDKGWAARSGAAGAVQAKINAAEGAEQLFAQGKTQPGGLDSRQIEEAAQNTARLLGGTGAASARVEALVPHTAWGQVQTFKEWLSNKPTGQEQQAFVDRLAETVAREKALAENQKRQFQVEGLTGNDALKRINPTRYEALLRARHIDPSMIGQDGRYVAPASDPSGGGAPASKPSWAK